ncbi:2-dehydro-3-deoxygalactonokinase [Rhizosaccharibacter radicis]|uniref:2-dehydro-3-deoxygalactonokinase n=1 Tax=Rhizosaccharibacter radicis TaxID=2782605 RepID=A0ABT1W3D3_9PROT|nr:2-dehydro-3-deoxygalactonokinase [Acetobacteraceae bacterium KSS12]
MTTAAALIALDWGTSSLRAWLLDRTGAVLARHRSAHGIMRLPEGGYPAAFAAATEGWDRSLPAIACGMVGSAQGWREVPYLRCPAGPDALADALDRDGDIAIVPGLLWTGDPNGGSPPEVMRGEETQILGVLALRPDLRERSLLVLPGTHNKWAWVAAGRVESFNTAMTGELFAVLRDHSILGRPAKLAEAPADEAEAGMAFRRGFDAAWNAPDGVTPLLFSVRTLVLTGQVAAAASLDYLSGLLIGDELRAPLRRWNAAGRPPVVLVGDPALCARYAAALEWAGVAPGVPVIEDAALDGLRRIARSAGWLDAGVPAGGADTEGEATA